jgi:hypothetical protein
MVLKQLKCKNRQREIMGDGVSIQSNVGLGDRLLRLGISLILFYLAFYFPATAEDVVTSYVLLAVVVINTLVALIGVCPVYLAIGINTAKSRPLG